MEGTQELEVAVEIALGAVGLAIFLIGWLAVSFSAPGLRRERLEWIAACGLYVTLLMFFAHLTLRAYSSGSTGALVAFGFMVVFFASGFSVCLTRTVAALRGQRAKGHESATN